MSLILLGILNSQVSGAAGGGYDLLETLVLSSSSSSVAFTGLGSYSDYKHLQIRAATQIDKTTDTIENVFLKLNGATSGYSWHYLNGNGTSVNSGGNGTATFILLRNATISQYNSDYSAGFVTDILDFSSASKNTTTRTLSGSVAGIEKEIILSSGSYNNTSAVTSIELYQGSFNFNAGSRFSLYGVK